MSPRRFAALFPLALLAAVLAAPSSPASASETKPVKKVTSIEGITEYLLDNGVKVLLYPDASKPTVTVNLTVFVGSRHEGYGEAGMAHLLEHMLFKGTPDHPNVPKVLQDRGARFNGTTWVDRTNYYETLPASEENLEFAIALEADRMVNSYVKDEDLQSEMTVVRNEFERGENSPSRVLNQRMMSAAYEWHNYGRTTIGNRADIERVPIDSLKRFYKRYYQPDNAMVVVSGRFDEQKALDLIEKHFGVIPKPERKLAKTYTEEPAQDGERFVTLRRVGDVPLVGAMFHIPSGAHPDYAAIDALESILTAAPAGRLYKSLVESKKAASVSGAAYAWHDPGVLRIIAEVAQGNDPQVVLGTMLDTLDEVVEKGVTEEEVERARARLLKLRELSASDSGRVAIELSEWAAQGDWRLYFLYRDRVEEFDADDVQRVAAAYLKRNNRTVGLFVPTEEPERVAVPGTPALAKMIGEYKGRKVAEAGEAFDVSPANIESRTQRGRLPVKTKFALLPKKTRGGSVNLRLVLRYGNEENLQKLGKTTEFLAPMMRRGTERYTRQELQDEFDRLQFQLGASSSAGTATFTLKGKRENLPAAIKLLGQVLRKPTFPESELDVMKRAQVAEYEQQLTNPQSLATTAVRRGISPWPKRDPRYVPTLEEEVDLTKKVSIDELKKLYKDMLGAGHGELAIVGDFDPAETKALLEDVLAGWSPTAGYERLARTGNVDVEGRVEKILTPGKANATYFAATVLPINDAHEDYPALVIGNFIFGGGSLASRLGTRVRQKEGLSYGVGSNLSASTLDKRATFYMYAITNPANVPKVQTVIREEFDKLLKEGITEEELKLAKQGYLQRQEVSRGDDSSLASTLADTSYTDRDMSYYSDLEEKIEALTVEDVNQALRDHLKWKRLLIVAAGDLEGAKAASEEDDKDDE